MTAEAQPLVAVVTGASSGIGKEAARSLAGRGWRVFGIGRNPARCREAEADILSQLPNPEGFTMICADLALMADTARAAEEISIQTDRVDVLLNNAGGVTAECKITPEGNENTFASNHLGHFLLTGRLLPLLKASAQSGPAGGARIVNVSSTGHETIDGLDWDDLQSTTDFASGTAYCRAKLANILFTRELARRFGDEGIVAHAMHPGVVHSNFVNHADEAMRSYMETLEGATPAEACDTLVWLATAKEPGRSNGEYFHRRERIPTSGAGRDDAAARRLWEESERLVDRSLVG